MKIPVTIGGPSAFHRPRSAALWTHGSTLARLSPPQGTRITVCPSPGVSEGLYPPRRPTVGPVAYIINSRSHGTPFTTKKPLAPLPPGVRPLNQIYPARVIVVNPARTRRSNPWQFQQRLQVPHPTGTQPNPQQTPQPLQETSNPKSVADQIRTNNINTPLKRVNLLKKIVIIKNRASYQVLTNSQQSGSTSNKGHQELLGGATSSSDQVDLRCKEAESVLYESENNGYPQGNRKFQNSSLQLLHLNKMTPRPAPQKIMLHKRRQSANQRERGRIMRLQAAFKKLKHKLPTIAGSERSPSKLAILRGAIQYIHKLQTLLDQPSNQAEITEHREVYLPEVEQTSIHHGGINVENTIPGAPDDPVGTGYTTPDLVPDYVTLSLSDLDEPFTGEDDPTERETKISTKEQEVMSLDAGDNNMADMMFSLMFDNPCYQNALLQDHLIAVQ